MSSPVRQPVSVGTDSHGFGWKPVLVRQINLDKRLALVVDDFGKTMEIRCDIMQAKGNIPEPGEQWLVHRLYGIWTFGAIINGTTRGVEVNNVTDLPESLDSLQSNIWETRDNAASDTAAAKADVVARTSGLAAAKGDILAATGAGTLARQPVGVNGSVPVADSTAATGITYRTPLALTAPLTGATAAGRYVGTTTAGAPTSGTFQTGDWITTQSGFRWTCTAGGTPGTWRSTENEALVRLGTVEADTASQETRLVNLARFGKHFYTTSGPIASFGEPVIIWPSGSGGGGIGSMGSGSGIFTPNRIGRWALQAMCYTDGGAVGWSQIWFRNNQSQWGTDWISSSARGTGYGGAGRLWVQTSWTGYITVASTAITVLVSQASSDGGTITGSYWFSAEFLGGP